MSKINEQSARVLPFDPTFSLHNSKMPTMINSNPPQDYTGANGHDATWIPNYGKRLVVQTVDDLANYEPERIWATYAVGQEVEDGFRDITMRQLANAVNFTAFWLESQIGKSDNFEVIAYLGLSDLRYAILFFAAVKCGYVVSLEMDQVKMINYTADAALYSLWCRLSEMQMPVIYTC